MFTGLEHLKSKILAFSALEARSKRREVINQQMSKMIKSGLDCSSCVGHCCTFEHNSMQVSPLEALDVYRLLMDRGEIDSELIAKLEENVRHFRLGVEPLIRGTKSFRRYYTCPFYEKHALGCSLDRESKPYGCLAFNPVEAGVKEAGHCNSQLHILEQQELIHGKLEREQNQMIKEQLQIYWDKMNLPNALLYLIKRFGHDY